MEYKLGDRVKCVNASGSSGRLVKDKIYTIGGYRPEAINAEILVEGEEWWMKLRFVKCTNIFKGERIKHEK